MRDYTDVLIRILAAPEQTPNRYPVEAQINGSGAWRGVSEFNFDKLDAGKLSRQEYGVLLGQQLLNPSVTRALEQAGTGRGEAVRIRLLMDEEIKNQHRIRWERMYLHVGSCDWNVAISPNTPFSRYIPDERPDREPPSGTSFRLLLAIANPSDLPEEQLISVGAEVESLLEEFGRTVPTARFEVSLLTGRTEISEATKAKLREKHWTLYPGKTTLDNISRVLHSDGTYHALHLICHGNYLAGDGVGVLYLENEEGAKDEIQDYQLQSWIHPQLQLVVYQACRTAALVPEGDPPFAGIAAKTVRLGVPAVVAMQDYVLMTDARMFAAAFYRALLRDGYVDAAVNEGRQAVPNSIQSVASTIPALFMSLQKGRLWQPDPVRAYVFETSRRFAPSPPLPLRVIQHVSGLGYDPVMGPDGPIFNLTTHAQELLETRWLTILTGPPGYDKTVELERQFVRLAEAYLKTRVEEAPVLINISELAAWGRLTGSADTNELRRGLQSVAQGHAMPRELSGRIFLFLVQSDRELSEDDSLTALSALLRLLDTFQRKSEPVGRSRALMVWDENAMETLRSRMTDSKDVNVLVVRPMRWSALREFLRAQDESKLADSLEERQISDLASAPWILARLREFARFDRYAKNRADALMLIFKSYLARFNTELAARVCAQEALEEIAWVIQEERSPGLNNAELLPILSKVRGSRDFRLSDLRDELFRCLILSPRDEEGVRFSYSAMQAYCAAKYLNRSRRRTELLEDITATLGRYSRMRHWESVLITLAGLLATDKERIDLLRVILAGSSLAEGEQVFLAVCMYMEMPSKCLASHEVVKQIIDTLVWRSRPDIPRPYADRRQAATRLSEMRHPDAICHLVALAAEELAIASGNSDPEGLPPPEAESQPATEDLRKAPQRFDNAGIRYLAVAGLLSQIEETEKYVREHKPKLVAVVDAWRQLADGNSAPIVAILHQNDPAVSPIAAFALSLAGKEIGAPPLIETYFYFDQQKHGTISKPDGEVLWAITEVFGKQDAAWLLDSVILRWLRTRPAPNRRLCYLIQRLGQIPQEGLVTDYLAMCLGDSRMNAQDRALRAYSKLNDPATNEWLVPLCEQIVASKWKIVLEAPQIGLKHIPANGGAWKLQQAALEVLRDIGNKRSIDIIRSCRLDMDPVLFQLSFQVSEEIYWRLTGGIAREDYSKKASM